MLCQSCEKREATTHVKTITGGELKEYRLCRECAEKLGYESFFSTFSFDLDKLFGSFIGVPGTRQLSKRCEFCGSTFEDIAHSGKVGCAGCYEMFYDELLPSLQRIHGRTNHTGKLAHSAGEEAKVRSEITRLQYEMEQAIKTQEFEKAAELRDQIRQLQKSITAEERKHHHE